MADGTDTNPKTAPVKPGAAPATPAPTPAPTLAPTPAPEPKFSQADLDAAVERALAKRDSDAKAEAARLAAEKAESDRKAEEERQRAEQIAAGGKEAADAVRAELAAEKSAREAETKALAAELKTERDARKLGQLKAHRTKAVASLRIPDLVPMPTLQTTTEEIDAAVAAAKARETELFGNVRTELETEVREEVTKNLPGPLAPTAGPQDGTMSHADRKELRGIRDPKLYKQKRNEIRQRVREKHGI